MTYDPKYKMRHRLPPVTRLLYYKRMPPPMVGDPFGVVSAHTWKHRCEVLYHHMMLIKRGELPPVPPSARRGLWHWDCA